MVIDCAHCLALRIGLMQYICRFVIADYFINKAPKVLYLDADIICQGTIEPLINFSFPDDKVAMVVAEGQADWWEKRAHSLGVAGNY